VSYLLTYLGFSGYYTKVNEITMKLNRTKWGTAYRIAHLLCPAQGSIKRWCCLTSVAYIRSEAGRLDGAYWLIGPGSAGLTQGCRCALPLQAWAGAYRGKQTHKQTVTIAIHCAA